MSRMAAGGTGTLLPVWGTRYVTSVRLMFIVYSVTIFSGLAYFIVIGLTHH